MDRISTYPYGRNELAHVVSIRSRARCVNGTRHAGIDGVPAGRLARKILHTLAFASVSEDSRLTLHHRLRFLTGYFRNPHIVGALSPSSPALAAALCEPFRRCDRPATVLEIGAGTGAITRYLGPLLGEKDALDVCELHPDFADILERDVLTKPEFAPGVETGRIRLLRQPVQDLTFENRYDFIISGLPLTAFKLRDVRDVFRVIRRSLKPDGVLSYFEYVGLRRTSRLLSLGRRRTRIQWVSAYLSRNIRDHQFDRTIVLQNIPPAHARHLRFEKGSVRTGGLSRASTTGV